MENQNNHEYGTTDPDFIDQNTLIDGNKIENEDQYKTISNEQKTEFVESDPDFIEQNTLVDNDNYARDEDPYQYQEEFVEDLKHPENDFEINKNKNPDRDLNTDNVINKKDILTDDEQKSQVNKDQD